MSEEKEPLVISGCPVRDEVSFKWPQIWRCCHCKGVFLVERENPATPEKLGPQCCPYCQSEDIRIQFDVRLRPKRAWEETP